MEDEELKNEGRQPQDVRRIRRWLFEEFKKHKMTTTSILTENSWFLPAKIETPQGPESGPLLYRIFKSKESILKQVVVKDFISELSNVMKNLENNIHQFSLDRLDVEESLRDMINIVDAHYRQFCGRSSTSSRGRAFFRPLSFSCAVPGIYFIQFKSGRVIKPVTDRLQILNANEEIEIQKGVSFECPTVHIDQTLEIYVLNKSNKVDTGGLVPLFHEFTSLEPGESGELFAPQKLQVTLEKGEIAQFATITVELRLEPDPEIFKRVLAHNKAQLETELGKCKFAISQLMSHIREITEMFPDIVFDDFKHCFYSEKEELMEFRSRKPGGNISQEKRSCNCCAIF